MKILPSLLIVPICFILALQVAPYKLDDAYITFRYVQQFLEGNYFSFNQGDPRIEGFTSTAWFALLTLASYSGIHIESFPLIFGSVIALIFALYSSRYKTNDLKGLFLVFTLLTPTFLFYYTTGMGTLLVSLLFLFLIGSITERISRRWGYFACIISVWIRPEALFLPLIFLVAYLVKKEERDFYLKLLASFCLGCGSLFFFRYLAFNELLPNTYYAKPAELKNGLLYVRFYYQEVWVLALLSLSVISSFYSKNALICLLSALVYSTIVILEGGDWMPQYRLMLPTTTLLAFSAIEFCSISWSIKLRSAICLLALSAFTIDSFADYAKEVKKTQNSLITLRKETQVLVDWIHKSQIKSVALVDIGEVAFRTDTYVQDLVGLTDKLIAKSPGKFMAKDFPLEYLFNKNIDLIVLRTAKPPSFYKDGRVEIRESAIMAKTERDIFNSEQFKTRYRFRSVIKPGYGRRPYYAQLLFLRDDFIENDRAKSLGQAVITTF